MVGQEILNLFRKHRLTKFHQIFKVHTITLLRLTRSLSSFPMNWLHQNPSNATNLFCNNIQPKKTKKIDIGSSGITSIVSNFCKEKLKDAKGISLINIFRKFLWKKKKKTTIELGINLKKKNY